MTNLLFRNHETETWSATATFSNCQNYRYSLTRTRFASGGNLLFILLNPSKADERLSDPTITRCDKRARMMGYARFRVCNLFGYRSTNPEVLKNVKDAVGPQNDIIVKESLGWADHIICSWGNLGSLFNRSGKIKKFLFQAEKPVSHLGLTADSEPKHLLYISYKDLPRKWI